jgi:hypothetical protein
MRHEGNQRNTMTLMPPEVISTNRDGNNASGASGACGATCANGDNSRSNRAYNRGKKDLCRRSLR